jgi:hypothetical protein
MIANAHPWLRAASGRAGLESHTLSNLRSSCRSQPPSMGNMFNKHRYSIKHYKSNLNSLELFSVTRTGSTSVQSCSSRRAGRISQSADRETATPEATREYLASGVCLQRGSCITSRCPSCTRTPVTMRRDKLLATFSLSAASSSPSFSVGALGWADAMARSMALAPVQVA